MERLTDYSDNGYAYIIDVGYKTCEEFCKCVVDGCKNCYIQQAFKKLATYEDLEEHGLLVRLPCKVGDDVYIIPSPTNLRLNILAGYEENNRVYHQHIGSITFTDGHWYATSREEYGIYSEKVLNDIAYGITWFTDHEKAEKKLEEMKKNE